MDVSLGLQMPLQAEIKLKFSSSGPLNHGKPSLDKCSEIHGSAKTLCALRPKSKKSGPHPKGRLSQSIGRLDHLKILPTASCTHSQVNLKQTLKITVKFELKDGERSKEGKINSLIANSNLLRPIVRKTSTVARSWACLLASIPAKDGEETNSIHKGYLEKGRRHQERKRGQLRQGQKKTRATPNEERTHKAQTDTGSQGQQEGDKGATAKRTQGPKRENDRAHTTPQAHKEKKQRV